MEKFKLAFVISLFGTVGIICLFIPMSSSAIAFYRGIIGSLFLFLFTALTKHKFNLNTVRKNLLPLIIIGILLACNWISQFESYRIASVSVGTVCCNTMPIFVIIFAQIIFKEKLNLKNILCIIMAMIGVVLVSNLIINGFKTKEAIGCVYGIIAAISFSLVVILNKKLMYISSFDKVVTQFFTASVAVLPYIFFIEKGSLGFYTNINQDKLVIGIFLLLFLCIIHTGFAYAVYYNAITKVDSTTIAILTYIDPLVALLLSHIFLKESLNHLQIIGAILILLATLINEFVSTKK